MFVTETHELEIEKKGVFQDASTLMSSAKLDECIKELIDTAVSFKGSNLNILFPTKHDEPLKISWNEKQFTGGWSFEDYERFFKTYLSSKRENIRGTSSNKKGCRIALANISSYTIIQFYYKHNEKNFKIKFYGGSAFKWEMINDNEISHNGNTVFEIYLNEERQTEILNVINLEKINKSIRKFVSNKEIRLTIDNILYINEPLIPLNINIKYPECILNISIKIVSLSRGQTNGLKAADIKINHNFNIKHFEKLNCILDNNYLNLGASRKLDEISKRLWEPFNKNGANFNHKDHHFIPKKLYNSKKINDKEEIKLELYNTIFNKKNRYVNQKWCEHQLGSGYDDNSICALFFGIDNLILNKLNPIKNDSWGRQKIHSQRERNYWKIKEGFYHQYPTAILSQNYPILDISGVKNTNSVISCPTGIKSDSILELNFTNILMPFVRYLYDNHLSINMKLDTIDINNPDINKVDDTEIINKVDDTEIINKVDDTEIINKVDDTEIINKVDDTEIINKINSVKSRKDFSDNTKRLSLEKYPKCILLGSDNGLTCEGVPLCDFDHIDNNNNNNKIENCMPLSLPAHRLKTSLYKARREKDWDNLTTNPQKKSNIMFAITKAYVHGLCNDPNTTNDQKMELTNIISRIKPI